jgi:hypothetical protein
MTVRWALLLSALLTATLAFVADSLSSSEPAAAAESHSTLFADQFPLLPNAGSAPQVSTAVSVDKKLTTGGVGIYVSAVPFKRFMARTESGVHRWFAVATEAADANGIPRQFLIRLLSQESGFKPTSISKAGALGIAQFMPATAIAVGLRDPFEPVSAIHASAAHLATLLKRFGNLGLAAAAYNAGPDRVRAWLSGRRGLPEETRYYVRQVTGLDAASWMRPRANLILNASNVTAVNKPGSAPSVHNPSSRWSASAINLCQAINSAGAVCRVQTSY